MRQKATVYKIIAPEKALVYVVRAGSCGENCPSCKGCGTVKKSVAAAAKNTIGARAGDIVDIESKSSYILSLAFMVFAFPLLMFLAGYFICSIWNEYFAPLAGFAGMACAFVSLVPLNRYARVKNMESFEIVSIKIKKDGHGGSTDVI